MPISRQFTIGALLVAAALALGARFVGSLPAGQDSETYITDGVLRANEHWLAFPLDGRVARVVVDVGSVAPEGTVLARLDAPSAMVAVREPVTEQMILKDLTELKTSLTQQTDRLRSLQVRLAKTIATQGARVQRVRNSQMPRQEWNGGVEDLQRDLLENLIAIQEGLVFMTSREIVSRETLGASRGLAVTQALQTEGTVLKAPKEARVSAILRREGELVRAGEPILLLTAVRPLHVNCVVPEYLADHWREGDVVQVHLAKDFMGEEYTVVGRVGVIRAEGDYVAAQDLSSDWRTVHAVRVTVFIDAADDRLLPGMSVRVAFDKGGSR